MDKIKQQQANIIKIVTEAQQRSTTEKQRLETLAKNRKPVK